MIQDLAWIDFFISDLKINYMVAGRIKFKNSSRNYIGDKNEGIYHSGMVWVLFYKWR